MQEIYRFIDDAIEADRQRYTDIADQIWDHPETRFEEFWSAEHLASALESAGFTVTRNVGSLYCFVWSRQTGYRPAGRI
ncbi:aminobenzoyl-glutamate utilization protein B [Escherichia coli]|nr:aminobenzoyl-glutamate utilization protein B [Escherichia coli]